MRVDNLIIMFVVSGGQCILRYNPLCWRPWIDVFASPEKFNMAVNESDPEPKVRNMSITF